MSMRGRDKYVHCPYSPTGRAAAPGPCASLAPVRKHMDTLLIHHHRCNFVAIFPLVLFHVLQRLEQSILGGSRVYTFTCFTHLDCCCFHSSLHSFTHPTNTDRVLPTFQDTVLGAGDPAVNKTDPLPQGPDWRSVVQGGER